MAADSISVRLRRTIHHSLHVSVPVTPDVMARQPDGSSRIDTDKLFAQAVALGQAERDGWTVEDEVVELHPLQTPPKG